MGKKAKVNTVPTHVVRLGQRVYLPEYNIYGEVVKISDDVKGWIEKVKVVNADGSTTFLEVKDLIVEAAVIINEITGTKAFKIFWTWFGNLFRKKGKKKPLPSRL